MQLYLLLTNREGLGGDVVTNGCLGCSDQETAPDPRGVRQVSIRVQAPCFQRANFRFFRKMVGRISWETVLKSKGAQESHQAFKEDFLQA